MNASKVLLCGLALMGVPAFGSGRSTKRVPSTATHVKNSAKAKQKAKQTAAKQREVLAEDGLDAEERQELLKAQQQQAKNDRDLIAAVTRGDVAAVKRLVRTNANVHALTSAKEPLLHVAIKGGHFDIVEALLLGGARVLFDSTIIVGYPPFGQVTKREIATNTDKQNALFVAEKVASLAIVKLVRNFALLEAAQELRIETVKTLLEQGAEVNMGDRHGRSALWWNLNRMTLYDNPRHREQAKEMALLLLQRGANPNGRVYFRYENSKDPSAGQSILDSACQSGHWEAALILLDHGADVRNSKVGSTLLHSVISSHSEEPPETRLKVIKVLLQRGLDVNAKDAQGKTPLMLARENNLASIVSLLLANGATESTSNRPN